jgi:murein DD-endopeptidase MepM/ murein hydrolase activator NlpD
MERYPLYGFEPERPRARPRYPAPRLRARQRRLRLWSMVTGSLTLALSVAILWSSSRYDLDTLDLSASLGGPEPGVLPPPRLSDATAVAADDDKPAPADVTASAVVEEAQKAPVQAATAAKPRPGPRETPTPSTTATRRNPEQVRYEEHVIGKGESLWDISRRYRIDIRSIRSVNRLKTNRTVHPGQKLRIPSRKGLLHVVRQDDTLEDIALEYDVALERIVAGNAIRDPDAIKVGQELFVPGANIPLRLRTREREGRETARQTVAKAPPIRFQTPASGPYSSGFGYRTHPISGRWTMHKGLDIAAGHGSPVHASRGGRVTYAGPLGSYGRLVVVDHGDGYSTRYAHLSRTLVRRGDRVKQGVRIGLAGATGYTTGPHLHFEVWRDGKAVNPIAVLGRRGR